MNNIKDGYTYANNVMNNNIPVCSLLRLAVKRYYFLLKDPDIYFNEEEVRICLDFIALCKHSKGLLAGTPLILEPWQIFIIINIFGFFKKEDDTRLFRTGYIEVARKNGKTTWFAAVALYLMVADGEGGAEVYSCATKRDQARIIFEEAKRMVKQSSALSKYVKCHQHSIFIEDTANKFEPLASENKRLDGLNPHGVVADETHAWEGRQLWDVLRSAVGARIQPLIVCITTAGFNQNSIGFELHKYSRGILNKTFKDDSFFSIIYTIDEEDDPFDKNNWYKANPNLGISVLEKDLENMAIEAKQLPSSLNNFLCKRLNIWTNTGERWLPPHLWKQTEEVLDEDYLINKCVCFPGLDLSSKEDITALVLVFVNWEDPYKYYVKPYFYLPADAIEKRKQKNFIQYQNWYDQGHLNITDGKIIDYRVLKDKIIELSTIYNFRQLGYDSWNSSQITVELEEYGIECKPVRQGWVTMNSPMKTAEAYLKSKNLVHDDNPVMQWMITNLSIKHAADGSDHISPCRKTSFDKIDGAVAMFMSMHLISIMREKETEITEYDLVII